MNTSMGTASLALILVNIPKYGKFIFVKSTLTILNCSLDGTK